MTLDVTQCEYTYKGGTVDRRNIGFVKSLAGPILESKYENKTTNPQQEPTKARHAMQEGTVL